MSIFSIRPIIAQDRDWVTRFVTEHWGDAFVVSHGTSYYPAQLPGFVATREGEVVGLVTYSIAHNDCEIVTWDSLHLSLGIGTALIEAVKGVAHREQCKRLWLITTNDNLNALRFYQKRGFVLVVVHRNALEESRRMKPQIPLLGNDGIPLRDKIELEMLL